MAKRIPYEVIISIGDWSGDGHTNYDMFYFKSSHSRDDLQKAYRQSCKTSGIAFHGDGGVNQVCVDYEDCVISCYHMMMLHKAFRLDLSNLPETITDFSMDGFRIKKSDEFARIILWFIGKSLTGFKHGQLSYIKQAKEPKSAEFWNMTLNGWWGNLNHQFGYGIFGGRIFDRTYGELRRIHNKTLDHKVYFIKSNDRVIHEATEFVEHLPSIVMKSDFLYSLRYNNSVEVIREWCNKNLKGKVLQFEDRYFYEYEEDIIKFSEKFVSDVFLTKKFPYKYEEFSNVVDGEYKFFDDEVMKWCQKTFGNPYWYKKYGTTEMPNPDPDGEWACVFNRTLYMTNQAAVLFKLYWAGKGDMIVDAI